jgi:hypothetical protein
MHWCWWWLSYVVLVLGCGDERHDGDGWRRGCARLVAGALLDREVAKDISSISPAHAAVATHVRGLAAVPALQRTREREPFHRCPFVPSFFATTARASIPLRRLGASRPFIALSQHAHTPLIRGSHNCETQRYIDGYFPERQIHGRAYKTAAYALHTSRIWTRLLS